MLLSIVATGTLAIVVTAGVSVEVPEPDTVSDYGSASWDALWGRDGRIATASPVPNQTERMERVRSIFRDAATNRRGVDADRSTTSRWYQGAFANASHVESFHRGPFRATLAFGAIRNQVDLGRKGLRFQDLIEVDQPSERPVGDRRDNQRTIYLAGPDGAVEAAFEKDGRQSAGRWNVERAIPIADRVPWSTIQRMASADQYVERIPYPGMRGEVPLCDYALEIVGWQESATSTIAAFRVSNDISGEELISAADILPYAYRGVVEFDNRTGAILCRAAETTKGGQEATGAVDSGDEVYSVWTTHCTYENDPNRNAVLTSLIDFIYYGPKYPLNSIFVEYLENDFSSPPDAAFLPETYGLPPDLFDEPGMSPTWRWVLAVAGLLLLAAVFLIRRRSESDSDAPVGSAT